MGLVSENGAPLLHCVTCHLHPPVFLPLAQKQCICSTCTLIVLVSQSPVRPRRSELTRFLLVGKLPIGTVKIGNRPNPRHPGIQPAPIHTSSAIFLLHPNILQMC